MKILLMLPFNTYGGKYDNEVVRRKGAESEVPLGLAYIKSYLKNRIPEIDILLYDANIYAIDYIIKHDNEVSMDILWNHVKERIVSFNPDIVGISAFSHAMACEAHKIAAICKNFNPKIITVMGGSYPTLSSEVAMEDQNIDIIVMSEGEIVFYNLVKAILNNGSLKDVKGIIYRDNDTLITNPYEIKVGNLDDLPYPDLDDLPIELYQTKVIHSAQRIIDPLRPISIISSRGCIFDCGFCATVKVWGTARYRNPKCVIEEIKYLKKKYNINFVKLNDDLIAASPKKVIELCDLMIKEKPIENWMAIGLTVEMLRNKEMVEKMIESRHYFFSFSIESGCKNTLKMIKKPMRLEIVPEVMENLRRFKESYVMSCFIVGFPFETKDDIQETYDLASSLDLNWVSFVHYTPFPKTALYDYCIEAGYLKKDERITYNSLQSTNVISTPNFDRKWVEDTKYYNNLKINFVNNYALRKKDYELAKNEFKHVLKIAPDHAFALLFLGYACDKSGDKKDAKMYYHKAMTIFKQNIFWGDYFKVFEEEINSRI